LIKKNLHIVGKENVSGLGDTQTGPQSFRVLLFTKEKVPEIDIPEAKSHRYSNPQSVRKKEKSERAKRSGKKARLCRASDDLREAPPIWGDPKPSLKERGELNESVFLPSRGVGEEKNLQGNRIETR